MLVLVHRIAGLDPLTHFGSFGSLIPSTNSPRDAASNLSASGWLILAACIILFTSSAVTFIGSGCSESSAVSTFCGKPVYVPFFRAKYSSFVISVAPAASALSRPESLFARPYFLRPYLRRGNRTAPHALQMVQLPARFHFLGYQIPQFPLHQFVFLMTGEHQQCPGLFLHSQTRPLSSGIRRYICSVLRDLCECRSDAHGQGQK